jgi:hypothetical protein
MEFGGIYLDRDVVIIKSLDPLRKFEMTLDYEFHPTRRILGTQVQIAHKRARFLRLYLQTYQKYSGYKWYWNAGEYPTQRIINNYPHLVHSMNGEFGVYGQEICPKMYLENLEDWSEKFFTVHLFIRENSIKGHIRWCISDHRVPSVIDFDEQNIKTFKTTFGQIARFLLYDTKEIIND